MAIVSRDATSEQSVYINKKEGWMKSVRDDSPWLRVRFRMAVMKPVATIVAVAKKSASMSSFILVRGVFSLIISVLYR